MKNYLISVLIFSFSTFCAQTKTINYSLFSKLNKSEISPIKKSNSKVFYDFNLMKITVTMNNKKEYYKIENDLRQGVSTDGEDYSEFIAKKGQNKFL